MNSKRLLIILGIVAAILLIPFTAMQLTGEVNWSPLDFLVMGALLLLTGLTLDFIVRKAKTTRMKWLLGITLIIIFFLIWAELAVGIFGTPFAGS